MATHFLLEKNQIAAVNSKLRIRHTAGHRDHESWPIVDGNGKIDPAQL